MDSTDKKLPFLSMDKFPEWKDDERMNALFAPFRKASSNDQDSKSKINFWSHAIHEYLKNKGTCSFSIVELQEAFERDHCRPACLNVVVENMLRSGEVIPEEVFMRTVHETWTNWAVNTFLKTPSTWMLQHLKSYIVEHKINPEDNFIHIQSIRTMVNFLFECIADKENKAIPLNEYINIFKENGKPVTERTAKQILMYLVKNKKATYIQKPFLIKMSKGHVESITEQEEHIESLAAKKVYLTQEIQKLEAEQIKVVKDIKYYCQQNRKEGAKTLLRKKKELERMFEVRSKALVNIETLMMRISDASMGVEMVDALGIATGVLKKYNKNINEDRVANVQDELREKIEDIKSVEDIMSENVDSNSSILESELEQELEAILLEEEQKQIDLELPDLTKLHLKDLPNDISAQTDNKNRSTPDIQTDLF